MPLLKARAKILRPAIQATFDEGGLNGVVDVVCKIIDEFEARITAFESRIAELERRLNKNSSNSSKPPSSDGLNRSNSMRPKNTGRKPPRPTRANPSIQRKPRHQAAHHRISGAAQDLSPLRRARECRISLRSHRAGAIQSRHAVRHDLSQCATGDPLRAGRGALPGPFRPPPECGQRRASRGALCGSDRFVRR